MSDRGSLPAWRRAKPMVFAGIAAMTAYVLYHNERFLIRPSDPVWEHYAHIAWWLVPHGIVGACALLVAPFQFSNRLRKRYTAAHRIGGRLYVAGALIVAPLGVVIQYVDEALGMSRAFTILATVDAVLLMATTAVAFLFAVRGRITLHRQWMTRSYAVALVFFEGRFVSGVFGLDTASEPIQMAVIWSCLALALLVAEVVNSSTDILNAVAPDRSEATRRQPNTRGAYSFETPTA